MADTSAVLTYTQQHGAGLAAVAYAQLNKKWRIVTCGEDAKVVAQPAGASGTADEVFVNPHGPLHCLIAPPDTNKLVVGDDQRVQVLKLPADAKAQQAGRWIAPVKALACNSKCTLVAAAGDQDVIRIINLADTKVVKQLRVDAYVRSVAWDPEDKYLAALQADGSLLIWEVDAWDKQPRRKRVGPKVDPSSLTHPQLAWHPYGGISLAVPGSDNEVLLFERECWAPENTWEPEDALDGEHSAPVTAFAFCPNGHYAASAGRDKQLCVWDTNTKKCIRKVQTPEVVASICWHPAANELAVACEDGSWAAWAGVVPEKLLAPHLSDDELDKLAAEELHQAEAADGELQEVAEMGDFIEEDPSGPGGGAPGGRSAAPVLPPAPVALWRAQEAIQSSSTPLHADGRPRFLQYNMLGCIISRNLDTHHSVEVVFHNSSRKRVPPLTDYYGFTLAALSQQGAAYAAPASREAPAVIMFRPFESWAPHSDWSLTLPGGEEPLCIAAGQDFVAVATSMRLLRLFSCSGLQLAVITLEGAPVALTGSEQLLAVVLSSGLPAADGCSQNLQYTVYDVPAQVKTDCGPLPLSEGASLTWLAFSAEGLLASCDSSETIRVLAGQWGGSWLPVFQAEAARTQGEVFWPVGLQAHMLFCIVCNPHQPHPQVSGRPILTSQALQVPMLAGDQVPAASAALEAELLQCNARLARLQAKREAAAGAREAALLEDEMLTVQTQSDKALLRLFLHATKAGHLARALDLAARLTLYPSLEGALKLANNQRANVLADRIVQIMQQRSELDTDDRYESGAFTPLPARTALQVLDSPPANVPSAKPAAASSDAREQPSKPAAAAAAAAAAAEAAPRVKPPASDTAAMQGSKSREPAIDKSGVGKVASFGGATAAHAAPSTASAAAQKKRAAGSVNPFMKRSKTAK